MKVGVVGSVGTTALTLRLLYENGFEVVGVLGYEPDNKDRVSGWYDLRSLCVELKLPFKPFMKINDDENYAWMKAKEPEVIFAVGFSQLINEKWLKLPKLGCVGFHPTKLPEGRGRAPLAWLILESRNGAASFFVMGEGADDGPILIQEPFYLDSSDDAESLKYKIHDAIKKALSGWLPRLKNGEWDPLPQDHSKATYYGKRAPEDGYISWDKSCFEIDRLVKATTSPYPGAFTMFKDNKIIVWNSRLEEKRNIRGVVGRVVMMNEKRELLVQCGEGLLWLTKYEGGFPKVGDKLGVNLELELFNK